MMETGRNFRWTLRMSNLGNGVSFRIIGCL